MGRFCSSRVCHFQACKAALCKETKIINYWKRNMMLGLSLGSKSLKKTDVNPSINKENACNVDPADVRPTFV